MRAESDKHTSNPVRSAAPLGAALAVTALICVCLCGPARADNRDTEVKITAAFVFNFCKFVDWPQEPGPRMTIKVLGGPDRAADFGSIAGKSVRNCTLEIAASNSPPEADPCQVFFIPADRADDVPAVLGALEGRPVLTVSDSEGFCDRGGMIEMNNIRGKLRFCVNSTAAERVGLTISSQLLKMARRVIKED